MTAPFEPVTIVEEFIHTTLAGDATLLALLGGSAEIWPAFSPASAHALHLTHDFSGPDGGEAAVPMGQGIALLSLTWDITAWTPGQSRQALRPVMQRVQAVLTGPSIVGQRFSFGSNDGSGWAVAVHYRGPIVVPAEVNPTWQRVCGRFWVELRQKG
jgi:hypothetical protein